MITAIYPDNTIKFSLFIGRLSPPSALFFLVKNACSTFSGVLTTDYNCETRNIIVEMDISIIPDGSYDIFFYKDSYFTEDNFIKKDTLFINRRPCLTE